MKYCLSILFCLAVEMCVVSSHKFYMYDGKEWDRIATASHHKRDPREILNMTLNSGAGQIVDARHGLYHTDQYHMYDLVYFRLLTDRRRTLNPEEATSFFVPYDLSLDCAFYKNCARSIGVCYDFRKCPLAPKVEKMLAKSPFFRANQGRDHFTIIGMNYAMEHFLNKPKCKSFLINACRNCTKFAIDDYSFLFKEKDGVPLKGDDWHAAPFPGDFHWSRKVEKPYPYEHRDRPLLVSYIGTKNSYWAPARRLRGSLVHYCALHASDCVHVGYGANGTRSSMLIEGYTPLEVAKNSIFCLQPYGDLMTRKGLFDTLLMGCIPVTFSALTATSMYVWHWSEELWHDVAVSIPAKSVSFRYQDPIVLLRRMAQNVSDIERRQRLIREHVFKLQWSIEPPPQVNTEEMATTTWPKTADGKLVPDAFELMLNWTLGWHSGDISREVWPGHIPPKSSATANPCWTGEPNEDYTKCVPKKEKSISV